MTHDPRAEGDEEALAWDRHRSNSLETATDEEKPQGKRLTPHAVALRNFAEAHRELSKHRAVLRNQFGYTDQQLSVLGKMASGKRQMPYHALARAAGTAKRKLDSGR